MSDLYTEIRGDVKSALAELGGNVKLVTSTGRTITSKGVRVKVKQEGQAIAESAAYLLHGALSVIPSVGDYIHSGSQVFRINYVEVSNPGGTTLLYKCHVE